MCVFQMFFYSLYIYIHVFIYIGIYMHVHMCSHMCVQVSVFVYVHLQTFRGGSPGMADHPEGLVLLWFSIYIGLFSSKTIVNI
jgi:hypothetical protein